MNRARISVSWSGGKDCAFALFRVQQDPLFEVVELHTTINSETRRVGLHGIHEALIDTQARAIGLPLRKLYLEPSQSNDAYEALMNTYYHECRQRKIDAILFGDIFLEDLRQYRETLLRSHHLRGLYPLWKMNTGDLVREFIRSGFKSIICSADGKWFGKDDVGKLIDDTFIKQLPPAVDPCGENGEFHSYVFDGPVFIKPVHFYKGEVIGREYTFEVKDEDGVTHPSTARYWFIGLLSVDGMPAEDLTLL